MRVKSDTTHHPRIAHRELDDETGGALSGVLDEIVGSEPGCRLIVVRGDDGTLTAYDERELVSLGGENASKGPVLLKPRHFFNLMKQTPALLAVVFVLALIVAVNVAAILLDLSLVALLVVFGSALLVAMIVLLVLERELIRGRG